MSKTKKQNASPGDGSLKRRSDGRWEYRVIVGMDADMKPIRKSFYSRDKSGAAAKKEYRDWLSDQRAPIEQVKTVKQWAEYWLDAYKKGKVAYKSYKNYCLYVNNHIVPALGRIRLDDVRPAHIETLYTQKVHLSSSARQHIRIALNGIFDTAIDNHLCRENPCKKVRPPKTPKKKPRAWCAEQAARILAFVKNHPNGKYVQGLLYTGLREGELSALTWSDIHIDESYIDVTKTVAEVEPDEIVYITVGGKQKQRKKYAIKDVPKSGRDRIVALTPQAVEFFAALPRSGQYVFGDRIRVPKGITPIDNVFLTPNQFRYRYEKVLHDFNATLPDDEKIPMLSPHKCRHTYATRLLAGCGNIRAVQEQLGHADISTTEIYTQVDIDSRKQNVSMMLY